MLLWTNNMYMYSYFYYDGTQDEQFIQWLKVIITSARVLECGEGQNERNNETETQLALKNTRFRMPLIWLSSSCFLRSFSSFSPFFSLALYVTVDRFLCIFIWEFKGMWSEMGNMLYFSFFFSFSFLRSIIFCRANSWSVPVCISWRELRGIETPGWTVIILVSCLFLFSCSSFSFCVNYILDLCHSRSVPVHNIDKVKTSYHLDTDAGRSFLFHFLFLFFYVFIAFYNITVDRCLW